ncbi:hypothetical protein V5799_023163 [Amblyomma americanum]|uniref:glycerophosphocholine cholinephosphodiesterase n=1 Tax=Amblyomma americanum TaxID=6943 RepID=A0AAQ4FK49_AMBAM
MSAPESFHPRWWTRAEPLWTRALRRNRTVAMFWWDGCQVDINGTRPQSCSPYGGYSTKIDRQMEQKIQETVVAFKRDALDLAMFYYEGPDAEGHRNGPDSEGIESAVGKVDHYLWNLQMGLEREGLSDQFKNPAKTLPGNHGPPPGIHGYDPMMPDMWGIFFARGPAVLRGSAGPSMIRMVDVYNVLCYMLGMDPAANSGSWNDVKTFLERNYDTHLYDRIV